VGFEDLHTSARETSACLLGGRRQLRAASDHYHSVVIAVSALFGDERLRASRRWRASTVRSIGIAASCRRELPPSADDKGHLHFLDRLDKHAHDCLQNTADALTNKLRMTI
jgi:hypothetical protein